VALMACAYFLLTTVPVATVIALTERKSLIAVWRASYLWVFPYYLLGAGSAALLGFVKGSFGWQTSMLAVPVMYLIYRSYRMHLEHRERERNQEQLRREKDLAEAATRVKSEFLAMMSHEIRTPMNGILGMAGLLLESGLNEEQLHHTQALHCSADALLTIINDILDISKIESGKLAIEHIPFDLHGTIEQTVEFVGAKANEKGIDLIVDIGPDVPRAVMGDPGRLRQVVINLLGNAIKFTSQGHVFLNVTCEQALGESARLLFRVEDTGIGVPPEKLEHIFERFTQADASTTRKFGGTGLGLAISKQLVELMHGSIGAESIPGRPGSTFWFTLELGRAEAQPRVLRGSILSGLRILVVDSNGATRPVHQKQMLAWGARCVPCAGVDEAIQAARAARQAGEPFHISVLNPEAPGTDAFVDVRWPEDQDLSGMAQIVLTSGRQARRLRNSGRAGVSYLLKPVVPSKLLNALVGCAHPLPALLTNQRPTQVAPARAADATPATASAAASFQARVLCADDNKINQRLARHLLEKLGCEVDIASNGREAIDLAERVAYDLIFMDCLMPDLDGFEATKEIRRREPEAARCPIIALTANAMRGDRERCLEAGMDDFLSKPVRREDFSRMLDRYLLRTTAAG